MISVPAIAAITAANAVQLPRIRHRASKIQNFHGLIIKMKNLLLLLSLIAANSIAVSSLFAAAPATVTPRPFDVEYHVDLLPKTDQARVKITLGKGADVVKALSFEYDAKRFSGFAASSGKLDNSAGKIGWQPAGSGSTLSYVVKISRTRGNGSFDARMTADWAIFRGDKIIPTLKARMLRGAASRAKLRINLPTGWTNVDTGWARLHDGWFAIDSPERKFDRPIGWMIAGKVGTRRDHLGTTEIAIAAPKGDPLDRMDALTLINFVWPEIEGAFGKTPRKILIVGAGDPMWRGGLSAPNSLFLHSERPLISENATSTLVHELVHVVTRIRGDDRSDWIAEGLAEFYSVELIYRAGGMSEERHDKVYAWMKDWSRNVKTLRGDSSNAEITARAVLLLRDLDQEIRKKTGDRKSIDDLVRALRPIRKVSTTKFIAATEALIGGKSQVLATPMLR